jgi:hypothetical protein
MVTQTAEEIDMVDEYSHHQNEQQPEPPVLKADPAEECGGDLRVLTFAYPEADEPHGACKPEYQRLADIEVTVTRVHGTTFSDTKTTNDAGEAYWQELPAGHYRVTISTVSVPPGYDPQQIYHIPGGDHDSSRSKATYIDAQVREAAETKVEIGFIPEPARVQVCVYFDADHSGSPHGQHRINGVAVDFYRGEERIACNTTTEGGTFEQSLTRLGLITLVARSTVRVHGSLLRLASPTPLMIQAEPGQTCEVAIAYVASLAAIQVRACLMQQTDDHQHMPPLPGVQFSLYRGMTPRGAPLREGVTQGQLAHEFSELDEGHYCLVASGPKTHNGQMLELHQPAGGILCVHVCAGQTLKLFDQFCFRPCTGRVVGMVVDEECGEGLTDVPILLTDGQRLWPVAYTTAGGNYTIDQVPPGNYRVSFGQEKITFQDNSTWVPSESSKAAYDIVVRASTPTRVPELRLTRDEHKIWGYALRLDGSKIPYAVIEIQDAVGTICTVTADPEGKYEWIAPRAGTYYLLPQQVVGTAPRQRMTVSVNSTARMDTIFTSPGAGGPSNNSASQFTPTRTPGGDVAGTLAESVVDLTAYPILTEEITNPAASRPVAAPAAPGMAPLGQLVEGALRDVLGWRPKASDTKGFTAALNQAFTLQEVEGHTKWTWTPRSYAVQTDMGAVTGAQASIYNRAKVALDQSLPLLDGLYSLQPAILPEDQESIRAVVRAELTQLVNEFGVLGGPRVQRVDELFLLLLGNPAVTNPEQVAGVLGTLGDRFGLARNRVNTIEDEQNLTNYLILVDYVIGLSQSWITQKPFFVLNSGTTPAPFLGTQLVLLSRAMDVVVELVQDAYFAMDSVFLGPAERQTVRLKFASSDLFIGDLLDWVDRVASDEGRRLIDGGGKDGVGTLTSILDTLRDLVRKSLINKAVGGTQDGSKLVPGYSTPRVQRALLALADQLDATHTLAEALPPPTF